MARVVYIGPDESVATPAHFELIARGVPVELDDVDAGGLVGYGHGDWRYADAAGNPIEPVEVDADPVDPVRAAALAGVHDVPAPVAAPVDVPTAPEEQ